MQNNLDTLSLWIILFDDDIISIWATYYCVSNKIANEKMKSIIENYAIDNHMQTFRINQVALELCRSNALYF